MHTSRLTMTPELDRLHRKLAHYEAKSLLLCFREEVAFYREQIARVQKEIEDLVTLNVYGD